VSFNVGPIPFADLDLARRLEQAEGRGNVAFVEARAMAQPDLGATWTMAGGAFAMFDGVGSPCTQTFGLGMADPIGTAELDALETFFISRGADVCHEVSPLAGVELAALLATRGYKPIELSTVLFRPLGMAPHNRLRQGYGESADAQRAKAEGLPHEIGMPNEIETNRVTVRHVAPEEADLFAEVSSRGWSQSAEVQPFIEGLARLMVARRDGQCFVAELDGTPVATGAMSLWNGVALLAGASTVPEGRRRGAQLALLDTRLGFAASHGCDLAMMCTAPGSTSQRNAERNGFRIAYTRTKWQLTVSDANRRSSRAV
jgi:hypothetical protein